jgi:heme exporter protein CcmD
MTHAMYVWASYGVAAVLLIGLLLASWLGLRAREAELDAAGDGGRRRRNRS